MPTIRSFDSFGHSDALKVLKFCGKETIVLDFGCGIGRVSKHIAPYVKKVLAADKERSMLKLGKRYCHKVKNISWLPYAGTSLSIRSETVDVAFSFYVFQHSSYNDTKEILAELYRVLRQGGKGIFQFPDTETHHEYFDYSSHNIRDLLKIFSIDEHWTQPNPPFKRYSPTKDSEVLDHYFVLTKV